MLAGVQLCELTLSHSLPACDGLPRTTSQPSAPGSRGETARTSDDTGLPVSSVVLHSDLKHLTRVLGFLSVLQNVSKI